MEEIGLIFEFVEQNYRGSNEKKCILKVMEEGNGVDVRDE